MFDMTNERQLARIEEKLDQLAGKRTVCVVDELENEKDELIEQCMRLQAKLSAAQQKNADLHEELELTNDLLAQACHDLTGTCAELALANDKLKAAEALVQQLRDQLTQLDYDYVCAKDELSALQRETNFSIYGIKS